MSFINISFNIMSPSKERNCDNVTYMVCMLIGTLWLGCFNFMIMWSNICLEIKIYEIESKGKW
jgi:hypothetical protein